MLKLIMLSIGAVYVLMMSSYDMGCTLMGLLHTDYLCTSSLSPSLKLHCIAMQCNAILMKVTSLMHIDPCLSL